MDAQRGSGRCSVGGEWGDGGCPCCAHTSPKRVSARLSLLSCSPADRYVSAGQAATQAWLWASSGLWAMAAPL